jgi:hypothetical protein
MEQESLKRMKAVVQVFSLIVPKYAARALEALSRAQAPTFKFEGADDESLIFAFGTFIESVIENRIVSDDGVVAFLSFVDWPKLKGNAQSLSLMKQKKFLVLVRVKVQH